jgi:hypothetical protein
MLAVSSAHLARQHTLLKRPEMEKTLLLAKYRPIGAPGKLLHESTTFIRSTRDAFTDNKSCFNRLDDVGLEDYNAKKDTAKEDDLDDLLAGLYNDDGQVQRSHCLLHVF